MALSFRILAATLLAGVASAQLRPPEIGTAVIAGRVIDGQTGAPVPHALVNLSQVNPPIGTSHRFEHMTADENGRFEFGTLPGGRFEMSAELRGFLRGEFGKLRPNGLAVWPTLAEGQRLEVTIELTHEAAISGVVVDERNRPMPDVSVEAWPTPEQRRGPFDFTPAPSARTDAQGSYRITGVRPGRYFVVVPVSHRTLRESDGTPGCGPGIPAPPTGSPATSPVTAEQFLADSPLRNRLKRPTGMLFAELPRGFAKPASSPGGRAQTYSTLFFPNATEPEQATPLLVLPGDERTGIDFQMRVTPAATVTGRLRRENGTGIGNATRLTLNRTGSSPRSAFGSTADAVAAVDSATGAFSLLDVPPGQYRLEARSVESNGCDVFMQHAEDVDTRLDVFVPEAGLEGFDVPMAEGLKVSGRVIFDGTARRGRIDVGVTPTAGVGRWSGPHGSVEGTTLSLVGLTPGEFALSPHDNNPNAAWFVRSLTAAGRDLTALPLVVDMGTMPEIELTMVNRSAGLRGSVVATDRTSADDATVVAFPADRRLWKSASPYLLRFASERVVGGRFEFRHLVPGDYLVVAVDERTMDDWPSQQFLERIAVHAVPMTATLGTAQEIALPFAR